MRRKDREMDREFALCVVDKCEYAVLGMTDSDGMAYTVPISIVRDGDNVYFHSAQSGMKVDCLARDDRVCLTCVGDTNRLKDKFTTEFESAIARGRAYAVTDVKEKIHALRLLCERHTPENMHEFDAAIERSLARTAVYRIEIDEISGKRKKYDADGKEMKFGRTEQK